MNLRLLVPLIAASQFAAPFMISGVAVALPAMGSDLSAGATALGLVETLFLAASVGFLLPVGRLAANTDSRTLYKAGLLAFGVSSILVALSSSMEVILALRFLQGAASAVTQATGTAILAEAVPPERRGRAFGISIGAVYAGLTLGPVCAGVLIDHWGWRTVFWAGGLALIASFAVIAAILPSRWRRAERGSVHLPSTLLVVGASLSLVLGSAFLREGWPGALGLGLGAAMAIAFLALQARLPRPVVNLASLLGNVLLRRALLVQMLLYMNAFCAVFLLSLLMQVTLRASANQSGQVIAIGTLLMAAMAPTAGYLADRTRPSTIASIGVALGLAAALAGMALDGESTLLQVGLVLAVQGLGFACFSTPNMTMIMNSVPPSATNIASALTAKARSLGMLFGMLVAAALLSLHLGHDPVDRHPELLVTATRTAFAILAIITAVALVLSVRIARQVPREAPKP